MTRTAHTVPPLLAAALLTLTGCEEKTRDPVEVEQSPATEKPSAAADAAHPRVAVARLLSRDPDFTGAVAFVDTGGNELRIFANLHGLTAGKHGFHIHTSGDCSADDFTSAGGHFAPSDNPHGAPDDPSHHAGDLGNVIASDDEDVLVELTSAALTLDPTSERSIVDRAVVVHAGADDLESQPSGDAGFRLACGVIEAFTLDEQS
jgi:Cu-Zn family superoxide dismutase